MALTNYNDLVTSVGSWLDRSDLTSLIPDFIKLFEARLNRELRHPRMETTVTTTATSGTVTLPSDFRQMRSIHVDGTQDYPLEYMAPAQLRETYGASTSGTTVAYTVEGTNILLGPEPASGTVIRMVYYAGIPALTSTNTTNWLMTNHPDIYLYGTLAAANAYLRDDPRLALWKAALDEAMLSLEDAGIHMKIGATPLTMRPSVFE